MFFKGKSKAPEAAPVMEDPEAEVMEDSSDDQSRSDSESKLSSDDGTTTNRSGNSGGNSSTSEPLTKQETKQVNRSKILVYVALTLAAAAVGTLTWHFTTQEENNDFVREFDAFSDEIFDVAESNAARIFGQMHSLSTTVTSFGTSSKVVWPNATLPHFDLRAKEAEELTGMELIVFSPVVLERELLGWEQYAWEHQSWIEEDLKYHREIEHPGNITRNVYPFTNEMGEAEDKLDRYLTKYDEPFHVPVWQLGPIPANASIINLDLYTEPHFNRLINDVLEIEHKLLSEVFNLDFLMKFADVNHTSDGQPRSVVLEPVFDTFMKSKQKVVGFLVGEMPWKAFFMDVLPHGTKDIVVDVKSSCGNDFTYLIRGHAAIFLGYGDLHDKKYDSLIHTYEFAEFARYDGVADDDLNGVHCEFTMDIYPTNELETSYHTNRPALYTTVVVLVFFFTAMVFALYDYMVYRRQTRLLATAKRTNAIVSSLFPKDVQKRIMAEAEEQAAREMAGKKGVGFGAKSQLKDFLGENEQAARDDESGFKTKPIADLFTECTIMFADIVGFTAWSSTREPAQVFTLLESIFHEYDQIAKRRRVFKVETVGDCYVAVVGLPDPRKDHATVMARFARDCLYKFSVLTKKLETTLGPDTAELGMRFGLHSGPVTAGVLRGEKARFQLFGDTMNTTARIESTGAKNKIHISQETADLLTGAGKGHWVRPREDKVVAKGKGELTTFWLELKGDAAKSSRSGSSEGSESLALDEAPAAATAPVSGGQEGTSQALPERYLRLVNWNAEILARMLKQVVARREAMHVKPDPTEKIRDIETEQLQSGSLVLEEVKEIIVLPKFKAGDAKSVIDPDKVKLGDAITSQLQAYLQAIAAMYRNNPFHNFEHASHVTMSVVKLLSRIVAPEIECSEAKVLHDHTYGITSDPLTQFAVILSALIHDVDHTGVPNSVLVQEQTSIAAVYKNKSVAEQNSVDIAWELLMQDCFQDLRGAIYATADEFKRFRQLVVNTVMATDIMDKELSAARKARWNAAFTESREDEEEDTSVNRKATIVIEHLIQASDVAHTMQHWHIYRKWNQRLFEEMYIAYKQGRTDKDPSTNWYEGEIGFFDFYIIPLAMKLRSCGVFGVSSDEYLNYAQQNRREWERKGQEIVAEMLESFAYSEQLKADENNTAVPPPGLPSVPEKKSGVANQA